MKLSFATVLFAVIACTSERGSNSTPVAQSGTIRAADSVRIIDSIFPRGWQVKESTSRMDDSKTVVLSLRADTNRDHSLDEPRLIVRCQEGETDLYVTTGLAERQVQFRLDGGRARTEQWSTASSGEALFSPSPIAFARELAAGKRMLFRYTPGRGTPADVEFDLTGLAQHLPKVSDACDWTGARLPRTKDPKRIAQNRAALLPWLGKYVVVENWSVDGVQSVSVDSVAALFAIFNGTKLTLDRIDSTRMEDGSLIVVIKR